MKRKPVNDRCCMNQDCLLHGKFGKGNIIRHSFYRTSQGRRRRYLCKACKKTFGSTKGTPYYRLHKSRSSFDKVATMAVEGVGISATARIEKLAPDTVSHWRESAADYANRFLDQMLNGFDLIELQADEIRTFVGGKRKPVWILTLLEVGSRLWVSYVVGRRSYRNIRTVIGAAIRRGRFKERFLFTTDGFEPYAWAAKSMLSFVCVYAQVIKKRCKNRVTQVNRRTSYSERSAIHFTIGHRGRSRISHLPKTLTQEYDQLLRVLVSGLERCSRSPVHELERAGISMPAHPQITEIRMRVRHLRGTALRAVGVEPLGVERGPVTLAANLLIPGHPL